jgi:hypothetical protein
MLNPQNEVPGMSASNAVEKETKAKDEKQVEVRVNGKPITIDKKTTVGEVLREAGYDPANHYLVEVKNGKDGKEYRDVTAKITLHDGEEFNAYYTADTPLS